MRAVRDDARPFAPSAPRSDRLADGVAGNGIVPAGWSARCCYAGRWKEKVQRSLLTLKALTYAETGGIVAAPTASLPEQLGGERNWDYRYCWLRDAALTLMALASAGYREEARAWRAWLQRSVAGSPNQLQIMYGLSGERQLTEWEVPWLPGYHGATPVRIGNAASSQLQLCVRRTHGRHLPCAQGCARSNRVSLGAATNVDRTSRTNLRATGRWNLGSKRRSP